jgi:recombination protein RecA
VERVRLADKDKGGGAYFSSPPKSVDFIPSGCTTLDCTLGGGWPLGRISNIVGDKSTGKTLLAIEAAANFVKTYDGKVWYREAEAAFDKNYAAALGMPISKVDFGKQRFDTVEDVFEDLKESVEWSIDKNRPGLYIVDSLDALSDRAEMVRKKGEGSYGTAKAKELSELFRRQVRTIEESHLHVMFISQVRDNIGAMFGKKQKRSGGHALDFYASQVLWLSFLGQVHRTVNGHKRTIGVDIKAKCEKNKIALPFRECEFTIEFGFGTNSIAASVNWLKEVKRLGDIGLKGEEAAKKFLVEARDFDSDTYRSEDARIAKVVREVWTEIETTFLPKRKKY